MSGKIVKDIEKRLKDLGIVPAQDLSTDWTIDQEFLDASWSTGTKKIRYEADIFVSDADQTVYMYEKTIESGGGLSFGGEGESFTQNGKTLSRKVKSVQYGPEGKVVEIELNLGAISNAVKEAAKDAGYNFKIVLRKKKAQYPPGVIPPIVAGTETSDAEGKTAAPEGFEPEKNLPAQNQSKESAPKPSAIPISSPQSQGEKIGKGSMVALAILSAFLMIWNILAGTSILGWFISAGILVFGWRWADKKLKGKTLMRIGLLALSFLIALVVGAATGTPVTSPQNSGTSADRAAVDAGKVLRGFDLTVGRDWIPLQDSGFTKHYTKEKANIYSNAILSIANNAIDEKIYNDLAKNISFGDIEKYAAYHASQVDSKITGQSMVRIGEYQVLKVTISTPAVAVADYIYFINVPGDMDLILHISSAASAIEQIEDEWIDFLETLTLKYE